MYSTLVPLWLLGVFLPLTVFTTWRAFWARDRPRGPRLVWLAALPAASMAIGFYALALHMHEALGAWPQQLGTKGFPPALVTHANFWGSYFGFLLLSLLGWSLLALLAVALPQWRRSQAYFSVYALTFIACLTLMLMAPKGFSDWWWD